jgi:hypothetical protein
VVGVRLPADIAPDGRHSGRHLLLEDRLNNSTIAAARLPALGDSDVRKYAEGKQDWVEAGLPVESGYMSPTTSRL